MAKDTKDDIMLDWFLSRHKDAIMHDLATASDAEKVCENFPMDRIMDFLDLLNSNVLICLLITYKLELLDIIADAVDANKFKMTIEQLEEKQIAYPTKEKKAKKYKK